MVFVKCLVHTSQLMVVVNSSSYNDIERESLENKDVPRHFSHE
jgi:hypothetical protein